MDCQEGWREADFAITSWNHFCNADLKDIHDDLLRAETDLSAVTAVFQVSCRRFSRSAES